MKDHPIHVVTEWMGSTPRIAMRHYLRVTEADFDKALQEAVQQPAAPRGNVSHATRSPNEQSLAMLDDAKSCGSLRLRSMEAAGIE
jgi:hypothetical protein